MKFKETSDLYSLNKSTYVNLRWIAYSGQFITVVLVQFLFKFQFNYLACLFIIFLSVLTNFYLIFRIKKKQLENVNSTFFLAFDNFKSLSFITCPLSKLLFEKTIIFLFNFS